MEHSKSVHRRRPRHTLFGVRDDRRNMQAVDETPPSIAGICKSGRRPLRILRERYGMSASRPGIRDRLPASRSLADSILAREQIDHGSPSTRRNTRRPRDERRAMEPERFQVEPMSNHRLDKSKSSFVWDGVYSLTAKSRRHSIGQKAT
jgi:hypothetical protein